MKNDTCVYFHRRLDTNEVFYVGIGNNKRPYSKKNRSDWWHRIVSKAGYEVVIFDKGLSWKNACKLETGLIEFFGRKDLGKGNLVNMTDGGEGTKGLVRSAEYRAKLSASKKGEKAHNAKLTEEIVIEILYQLKFHYYLGMVNDLAKKYGVSPTSISEIKNNRTWKHIDRNLIIKKT